MCAAVTCARAAPQIFAHLNLLLAVFGGAALATAARLKWDPSTYIVLRELLPREYRLLAALLTAAGAALLLLAHLALAALARSSHNPVRRLLLLIYAVCMTAMVAGEVAVGVWAWQRVAQWVREQDQAELRAVLDARDHALALLGTLARWHSLPNTIKNIIEEVEADGPRNGYVAGAAGAALLLLQVSAAVLALLSRRRRRARVLTSAPTAKGRLAGRPHARRVLPLRSDSLTAGEVASLTNNQISRDR